MSREPARVVVGVDGGARSVALLRWAAYQALRLDAQLVVVHAYGSVAHAAPYAPARVALGPGSAAGRAIRLLDDRVNAAFDGHPPVPVHTICDNRRPVPALLDYATGAALLVIGTAESPDRTGAGLGPTARDCLRNAPCPVVLLPTGIGPARAEIPIDA